MLKKTKFAGLSTLLCILILSSNNACAEMDAYGSDNTYLGILQDMDPEAINIYNDTYENEAMYSIIGDGTFEFLGPEEKQSTTIYFPTSNCSGDVSYILKEQPYSRLFVQTCGSSSTPINSTDSGDLFITRNVIGSVLMRSKKTYIQSASCSSCETISPAVSYSGIYLIDRIDIGDANNEGDFVYPVETPVRFEHKKVQLDSDAVQTADKLYVNELIVNDSLKSQGTNNTFGSLASGSATISGDLTVASAASVDKLTVITTLTSNGADNHFGKIYTTNLDVSSKADINTLTVEDEASIDTLTVNTELSSGDTNNFLGSIEAQNIISRGAVTAVGNISAGTFLKSDGMGYFEEISSDKITSEIISIGR